MPFSPGFYGIEWGGGTVKQKKDSGGPISELYFLKFFSKNALKMGGYFNILKHFPFIFLFRGSRSLSFPSESKKMRKKIQKI